MLDRLALPDAAMLTDSRTVVRAVCLDGPCAPLRRSSNAHGTAIGPRVLS